MTTPFDRKIWSQPTWVHYSVAVILALGGLALRLGLSPVLGDLVPFGISLMPVAVAAYVGGFGPGMVTSLIGILGSMTLFVKASESTAAPDTQVVLLSLTSIVICGFISFICHRLRQSALRNTMLLEQIARDRRQTEDILNSITDSFYAVDKEWIVVQSNPAFDELIRDRGFPIVGRNLWEVFPVPSDHPIYKALTTCMSERQPQVVDIEDQPRSRWYQVKAYPTDLGISVFNHDVTDRKALELSRERMLADERVARSAAEETGRMKEEFLATLSHELRTPMTSLLGWANLLNTNNVSEERLREGLSSIEQSARAQAKMVEELLDVSRINAGKLRIEMEFLSLSEIADEAVSIHRPAAVAKSIDLVFEDLEPDLIVRGDSARLHQVISNLVSNAIKFSPRGGAVRVTTSKIGSTACCVVEDNGEGIEPHFLPHVFERFRQANSSSSRRYGGLGLGLSIAKQLIELQGGTLEAKSEGKGKGSTFTACLPAAALRGDFGRLPYSVPDRTTLHGVRVLVVEDDSATRLLLTRLIEEYEGQVVSADEASVALETLDRYRPHIIVSDVGLPNLDGYGFIRLIRSRSDDLRDVPAVALTAFARATDRRAAEEAGFSAFHTKPVNALALIQTLAELSGKR